MPRRNPPRNPHGFINVDKMRAALGLPPINQPDKRKRKRPKVIVMRQHQISGPQPAGTTTGAVVL
jgi:hypothetical protein